MKKTCIRQATAIGLLALALVAGESQAAAKEQQGDFLEIAEGVYVLAQSDPIAKFRLVTQSDQPFDNSGFNGKWSFVFFGFTHCPDLCPTTLAAFKDVRSALAKRREGVADVQFILVSVDPKRDTPTRLKEFLARFHSDFIGLTGDGADLARLSRSVGAMYAKATGSGADHYLMDHSSAVLLINPEGRLHAIFAAPHVPSKMVQAFTKIRTSAKPFARSGRAAPPPRSSG